MSDQITVRRRRVIPKAPYTVEEAEYTITVEKHEGRTIRQTLNAIDNVATTMLDQKLPFTETASNKGTVQDPFASLPWRQSEKAKNLSTIRLSNSPTGLEKELYERIVAGKGKHYEGQTTYDVNEFKGVKYLHRWKAVE
jgi:hypothetical protein